MREKRLNNTNTIISLFNFMNKEQREVFSKEDLENYNDTTLLRLHPPLSIQLLDVEHQNDAIQTWLHHIQQSPQKHV